MTRAFRACARSRGACGAVVLGRAARLEDASAPGADLLHAVEELFTDERLVQAARPQKVVPVVTPLWSDVTIALGTT